MRLIADLCLKIINSRFILKQFGMSQAVLFLEKVIDKQQALDEDIYDIRSVNKRALD